MNEIIVIPPALADVVVSSLTSSVIEVNSSGPSIIEVSNSGPQGIQGVAGPTGPVAIPNFYETSSQPLGATRGDQWIVTNSIGE